MLLNTLTDAIVIYFLNHDKAPDSSVLSYLIIASKIVKFSTFEVFSFYLERINIMKFY